MATSGHNYESIKRMLDHLYNKYDSAYNSKLWFRLLVCDYSWAEMHAVVAMNGESIEQYGRRIWHILLKLDDNELIKKYLSNKTSIISCCAHTMNRFNRSIKSFVTKSQKELCCYSFSLLINCLDLRTMSIYFSLITIVFMSKFKLLYM